MTDLEKRMIEAYLPHERDPELEEDEYFVLDQGGRVQRVFVADIFHGEMHGPCTYGVYTVKGSRHVKSSWDYGAFYKHELYDNRQDCRDRAHLLYDGWEELRKIQKGA